MIKKPNDEKYNLCKSTNLEKMGHSIYPNFFIAHLRKRIVNFWKYDMRFLKGCFKEFKKCVCDSTINQSRYYEQIIKYFEITKINNYPRESFEKIFLSYCEL